MACNFSPVGNGCGCTIGYNIPLLTVDGDDITLYAVTVLNINEESLGTANTPSEYVNLWNSDPDNQDIGTLYVGGGAFCFYIKIKQGATIPEMVLGDQLFVFVIAGEDDSPIQQENDDLIEV